MNLYLRATIGGRAVAIAASEVQSAVDIVDVVAVPLALPGIRGLAALRSRIMTVVDTSLMLGLAPIATGSHRAVVARVDGHFYAFLVDSLDDIESFQPNALPSGLALTAGGGRAATGVIDCEGTPHLIISLAALVPLAQAA